MKLTANLQRIPRATLFASSTLLILAGWFAFSYANQNGSTLALPFYCLCLIVATCAMSKINLVVSSDLDLNAYSDPRCQQKVTSTGESAGAARMIHCKLVNRVEPDKVTPVMVQQSLDFDGLLALRALEQVSGQWLVSDASDAAAAIVRAACLERVNGSDAELERAQRWFDIADRLRSKNCRALPKAELRRSFVAERVGVSKEQVRQIDQGRYVPLNNLLDEVDPKSL